VASNGNVFAPQYAAAKVYMWDAAISASIKLQAPSYGSGAWSVWGAAADRRKRRVHLPDYHGGRVYAYDDTGAFLQTLITGLTTPTNVAVGPTGDIYVVEAWSGKLQKFDGNGVFLGLYAGQVADFPLNVAVGPDGAVYVPEFHGYRVFEITCM
jgi:DNA-binding beta-propeller fold protein YncE